jgi:hypothetical protein
MKVTDDANHFSLFSFELFSHVSHWLSFFSPSSKISFVVSLSLVEGFQGANIVSVGNIGGNVSIARRESKAT